MKYYMPVKIYEEENCVLNHAGELASFGKKALIVTGRSSAKKNGSLKDVEMALNAHNTSFCVYSRIEENPSVETVMDAAQYGLKEGADFVIGIGGGSPLDAAKAIAFLLKRGYFTAEDLYDSSLSEEALDVIAIPTTCGTGSEVTGVSVLTVHGKQTKISLPHRIFPKLALIDGKYLEAAPQSLLVNTAVDALAHMIESYLSKKADDYSKAAVRAGLDVWKKSKDILAGKRSASKDDYANMMRASLFAGIAIAQTGTSIPHALSYILTYDMKMPHGMACGLFLGRYLKEADEEDREILLKACGFSDIVEFISFLDELLKDAVVSKEVLHRAYDTVLSNKARLKGCRFEVDEDVLKRIAGLQ